MVAWIVAALIFLLTIVPVFAGPVSDNYELQEYGFGAGGIEGATSGNYSINGIAGEMEYGQSTSGSYAIGQGLNFAQQADVPNAPTWVNPGSTYNRLKLTINTGGNPTDAEYAVAISTDNWVTTRYVQSDYTVGNTLGIEDWLDYTTWGGASGTYITGLLRDTTYKVKVKARQGVYTETGYGPEASAATLSPSLSFGIDSASLDFDPLVSSNSWTDSSKSTVLTTSTNAYHGYTVYARSTGPLTSGANTITDYASSNSSPTNWTGNGFGYTTDDASLAGGTANRFTSGGPKYAGFTTSAPGDPVADHTSVVEDTPISGEQFNIGYRVTAPSSQIAGTYRTTILYVVVPVY